MYKAYKFRLYPNDNQKILINKTFGCTRFIYNHFLNKCKEEKFIKAYDMCKELKELVLDYPFLKEVDSMALRCSIFNLEDSYKNYFSKRSAYPSFKNKFSKQSYRTNCITSVYKNKKYSNIKIDIKEKMIKVPKLGLVKIRGYRNLNELTDRIINITIEKEKTNKYYVSVITEKEKEIKKQSEKNLLEILKFSDDKNKKNKFLILITSALFIIAFATLGKVLLVKWGYILDSNLKYSQIYVTEYSNIKANVDVNKFGKINIDFDIGANKYGYAVFKNPNKAFNRLKKDYSKGIELIRKEFNLLPLNNFTYKNYKTYGWQVTTGTAEEKEQARFVSSFLDIYNNSFSQ